MSTEVILERLIETALNEPESVVDTVHELKRMGWTQSEVYDLYGLLLDRVRRVGTVRHSRNVQDVMDRIYGWCHPDYWLFDQVLSDT